MSWEISDFIVESTSGMYMCAQSCPTLCDLIDCSPRVLLAMEFSKQEYWSRLLFPTPGDLPDSGIKFTSLASPPLTGGLFTTGATWEAHTRR